MSEDIPIYSAWSHTDPVLARVEVHSDEQLDVRIMCNGDGSDGGIIGRYMLVQTTRPRIGIIDALEESLAALHQLNVVRAARGQFERPFVWDEALVLRRVGEIVVAHYMPDLLGGCLFFDPGPQDNTEDLPELPCLRIVRGRQMRWVVPVGRKPGIGSADGVAWGFHTPDSVCYCDYRFGPLQAACEAIGDIISHEASEIIMARLDPDREEKT